jgi:multisubunit Na+/H+ antiporter MnhB subunit
MNTAQRIVLVIAAIVLGVLLVSTGELGGLWDAPTGAFVRFLIIASITVALFFASGKKPDSKRD